ncbi:hypothetical protein F4804DRAFT_337671 [Jackrogersella minutella]|nr:hypothetical protein F4804DRAFT_337671 [Jackrogersella minutella]
MVAPPSPGPRHSRNNRPSSSSSSYPSSPISFTRTSTGTNANHNANTTTRHRDHTARNTTTYNTTTRNSAEIPVRQPVATAPGNHSHSDNDNAEARHRNQPRYQTPGPGFEQSVTNVPDVGLVYGNNNQNQSSQSQNRSQHTNPIHGSNPASGPQPQLGHQVPGFQIPQVYPPGFVQHPPRVTPQLVSPVSHQQHPAMAYTTSFMPNQGQHFQPPVPDTTYGPIPHTYHPRFDNTNNAISGQYTTIDGQIYQVVGTANVQDGSLGGAQVQYMPVQQVSAILTQDSSSVLPTVQTVPCYVAQQANSGMGGPMLIPQQGNQLPGIQQGPRFVPVGTQPSGFPAMVSQPQGGGMPGGGMPGGFPASSAPDVMGIGRTTTEVQIEQYHTALNNKALEGQDIAPADPDPSRMYYCRELDGEWTLRNRYGIDNMGDCRWYVMPGGIFYAVRLAD